MAKGNLFNNTLQKNIGGVMIFIAPDVGVAQARISPSPSVRSQARRYRVLSIVGQYSIVGIYALAAGFPFYTHFL